MNTSLPSYRVIIAGSRNFDDYTQLSQICDEVLQEKTGSHSITIVSGGAKGADSLGERYAAERGYAVVRKPADWERFGKAAGMIRNMEMAKEADALIAFWDGTSRGTEHMIKTAKKLGLEVQVFLRFKTAQIRNEQ